MSWFKVDNLQSPEANTSNWVAWTFLPGPCPSLHSICWPLCPTSDNSQAHCCESSFLFFTALSKVIAYSCSDCSRIKIPPIPVIQGYVENNWACFNSSLMLSVREANHRAFWTSVPFTTQAAWLEAKLLHTRLSMRQNRSQWTGWTMLCGRCYGGYKDTNGREIGTYRWFLC